MLSQLQINVILLVLRIDFLPQIDHQDVSVAQLCCQGDLRLQVLYLCIHDLNASHDVTRIVLEGGVAVLPSADTLEFLHSMLLQMLKEEEASVHRDCDQAKLAQIHTDEDLILYLIPKFDLESNSFDDYVSLVCASSQILGSIIPAVMCDRC